MTSGLGLKVFLISTPFSEGYSLLYGTKIDPDQKFYYFKSINLDLKSILTVLLMSKNAFRIVI